MPTELEKHYLRVSRRCSPGKVLISRPSEKDQPSSVPTIIQVTIVQPTEETKAAKAPIFSVWAAPFTSSLLGPGSSAFQALGLRMVIVLVFLGFSLQVTDGGTRWPSWDMSQSQKSRTDKDRQVHRLKLLVLCLWRTLTDILGSKFVCPYFWIYIVKF